MTTRTGMVFDLQRCSLYDGPGIRTTVFLKGCPLRCIWCHNPEAMAFRAQVSFNAEACAHCFACVDVCPNGAQQRVGDRHVLDYALCQACGQCVEVCPNDALRLIGQRQSVEAILEEVERDRRYYASSGGGLTLSGGEPMAQFPFTLALLQAAKARDLHTCLETCGFAPVDKYAQVLPYVDVFLFDYKATDPVRHVDYTGVSNEMIRSSFDFLYQQGAAIVLRCPLIPGLNDTPDHLAGIAHMAAAHPRLLGIELMAYHDLGVDKARQIGLMPMLTDIPTADETVKAGWLASLRDLGCDRVQIG
jgi:pyruvate formate lyase activating enzyme